MYFSHLRFLVLDFFCHNKQFCHLDFLVLETMFFRCFGIAPIFEATKILFCSQGVLVETEEQSTVRLLYKLARFSFK
jgi:hypothetical protein